MNRRQHGKSTRRGIKQARWLLLRNPENLRQPEQQVQLDKLLGSNQALMIVSLMKAQLKALAPNDAPSRAWSVPD
ncbi:DesA/ISL3 alpha bundle tail domain-containing protein [Metapseudomonas boanensis]|uniref:Transposase n=1 Tax=Metapseudomonas boanensis TaxID=2822138 RepID=A0ABS5XIA2_9GAMM|nr:transposase [Pseudomonas boanensis]